MSLKRDVSNIIKRLDLEDLMVKAPTIKAPKLRRIMVVALRMNIKVLIVFFSRRTFHYVRLVGGHIERVPSEYGGLFWLWTNWSHGQRLS